MAARSRSACSPAYPAARRPLADEREKGQGLPGRQQAVSGSYDVHRRREWRGCRPPCRRHHCRMHLGSVCARDIGGFVLDAEPHGPPRRRTRCPSSPVGRPILDLQFAILHYATSRPSWRSSLAQIIWKPDKSIINQIVTVHPISQTHANSRHYTPSTRPARRHNKPKQAKTRHWHANRSPSESRRRRRPPRRPWERRPRLDRGLAGNRRSRGIFRSRCAVSPQNAGETQALRCVIAKGAGPSPRARSPPPPPPAPAGPGRRRVRSPDARRGP